ncbi:MAG TPA: hypothetical protein VHB21_06775, partial [Minicystis sp.]|nr:hypothetical protein [Minicystis sp.]
ADLAISNDNSLFDALAGARAGTSAAPAAPPTSYVAQGTGNFYVRSDWTKTSAWSVFQCSRRLVDDHQHNDAGNFILTRGADDLVVDPSPYGSLSTLTGNAPAVDSAILPDGYSPSQAGWGQTTKLVWSKQSSSGVAVARCDYADQFHGEDAPSDVQHALRDYVLLPGQGGDATVVLVDRVVTGDASRGMHLRVRTPGTLSQSGDTATTTIGASALSVQKVYASSGSGSVRTMPTGSDCSSGPRGQCDMSRLDSGQEYRIDVAGPEAVAIHVVDSHAATSTAPTSTPLSGTGYRGAVVSKAGGSIAVIATDKADGTIPASLTYSAPANASAVHVVVDAPAGDGGRSDVTGVLDGTNCKMTVTPHAGASGGFDGHGLVVKVNGSCAVTDDTAAAVTPPPVTTMSMTTTSGAGGASATTPITAGGAPTTVDGGTAAGGSAVANDGTGGAGSGVASNGVGGTDDDGTTDPSLGSVSAAAGDPNHTAALTGHCAVRGGLTHNASAPAMLASCIGALALIRRRRARRS